MAMTSASAAMRRHNGASGRQLQELLRRPVACAVLAAAVSAPYIPYASARLVHRDSTAAHNNSECATAPPIPAPSAMQIGTYPAPVGINSPGISYDCGQRKVLLPVETSQVTGVALIKRIGVSGGIKYGTVSPVSGYHSASLQLNVMLSSREAGSECFYWVQSVLIFNTATKRISFAAEASRELLMASAYGGAYSPAASAAVKACNEAPISGSGSALKNNPSIYEVQPSGLHRYSLPMEVGMVDSASGNSIRLDYYVGMRMLSSYSISLPGASDLKFITMGNSQALQKFCACSYPVMTSLVFGGASGGTAAVFSSMKADIGLFYRDAAGKAKPFTLIMYQNTGIASTAEGASNISMSVHNGSEVSIGMRSVQTVQTSYRLSASAFSGLATNS